MHLSSLEHVQDLVARHLDPARPLEVVDVGAHDYHAGSGQPMPGSYRSLFQQPNWRYRGMDLAPGPNVDIVQQSAYRFPLRSRSVDLVISGQTFEHVEFFWLTWLEMVRVVRPGGLIFLLAPSRGPEHRYPVDCWRFYPDGLRALSKFGRLELVEVTTDWHQHADTASAAWGDTVGVFRKPADGAARQRLRALALGILARLLAR
ncbi:MAG: class I SAM-dependent methyltransferase [Proteobacteria bacterium]|nr:class I SAM-dependent methyltransferase [Pseudomonadota bacterium]MBI3498494.1 class I SAM-dependent methyltransferase [Pseudomonadota bacterium]